MTSGVRPCLRSPRAAAPLQHSGHRLIGVASSSVTAVQNCGTIATRSAAPRSRRNRSASAVLGCGTNVSAELRRHRRDARAPQHPGGELSAPPPARGQGCPPGCTTPRLPHTGSQLGPFRQRAAWWRRSTPCDHADLVGHGSAGPSLHIVDPQSGLHGRRRQVALPASRHRSSMRYGQRVPACWRMRLYGGSRTSGSW